MQNITPCLWFDGEAEEAANFYVSVFPNSEIRQITHYTKSGFRPEGSVLTVSFRINGQDFVALNGGPEFKFNEAVSFMVNCETQAEIDAIWDKLLAGGGEPVQCSWLKDKYGVSWQVAPAIVFDMLRDPDPERRDRVLVAVGEMVKMDIAKLKKAYEG